MNAEIDRSSKEFLAALEVTFELWTRFCAHVLSYDVDAQILFGAPICWVEIACKFILLMNHFDMNAQVTLRSGNFVANMTLEWYCSIWLCCCGGWFRFGNSAFHLTLHSWCSSARRTSRSTWRIADCTLRNGLNWCVLDCTQLSLEILFICLFSSCFEVTNVNSADILAKVEGCLHIDGAFRADQSFVLASVVGDLKERKFLDEQSIRCSPTQSGTNQPFHRGAQTSTSSWLLVQVSSKLGKL